MFIKITAEINNETKEHIICKERVIAISLDNDVVHILLDYNYDLYYTFNSNQDAKVFFDDLSKEFDVIKEF